MKLKFTYLLLLFVVIVVGCDGDDDDNIGYVDFGQKYNQYGVGSEWTYQVDSIVYDDFSQTVDTFQFQRRILIEEKLTGDVSSSTYKAAIYERDNDTSDWRKLKFHKWTYSTRNFVEQNDNIQIIRLVLPIGDEVSWDANAFNSRPEQFFTYGDLYTAHSVNNQTFDSVITVIQRNESNLIEQLLTTEKFAPRVGMIERKDRNLETELSGEIKSGYDVTQTLLSHN